VRWPGPNTTQNPRSAMTASALFVCESSGLPPDPMTCDDRARAEERGKTARRLALAAGHDGAMLRIR
jgi:hypothetical protein